ncbi:DnaJ-domain-containing protein [Meira miltonrushii]|uniref:DnaJ-domain-containing protein n=1 Tax=Meira miltonrushii TaxID=1280837 RepID=A0A316VEZ4_9BASI|nr:DnaJ-domain-containing protein [Meira miltonrushii]PWN36152.1 DnaJ-domain-containing protein [Meira miltonrushii]
MASTTITESLYVILGVNEDASTQEIKQAYKKAALRTHPDRALPEKKQEAETNFKRVAEAYEILSKPESRHRYDMFGTPGSPPPPRSSGRARPYNTTNDNPSNTYFGTSPDSKPFTFQWESSHDSARRAQAQRGAGFRTAWGGSAWGADPFELFNQMFEQELRNSRPSREFFNNHNHPFQQDPFFSTHRPMMPDLFAGFGPPGPSMHDEMDTGFPATRTRPFGGFGMSNVSSMMGSMSSGTHSSGGGGGHFVSESRETRTVNGRTETIIRKTDGQGNETVERITPEGRRSTLNGVDLPMLSQGNSTNAGMLPQQGFPNWRGF